MPTVAVAVAIYAGFMVFTWHFHSLPLSIAVPGCALLLAWQSSFQHETIHGHPTPWRRINTILGWTPLSLWLPYEIYRETHLRHHRCKGVRLTRPPDDPESHYLMPGGSAVSSRLANAIAELNRTLLGRLTIGPAVSILRFWKAEFKRLRSGDTNRLPVWFRHALSVSLVLYWVLGICHIPLALYLLAIVYPSLSLGQLRSYAEHKAHADPAHRTNVVETNRALALLFLNNNLHIVHHAKPSTPWYALPRAWDAMKPEALNNGMMIRPGYWHVIQAYFIRPIIAAEYPAEAN